MSKIQIALTRLELCVQEIYLNYKEGEEMPKHLVTSLSEAFKQVQVLKTLLKDPKN